ncbi:MAG: sugar transporter permease YjfF [Micrococcaceae bacterium]|jgi:ribose/xylose/arabinose/galactoside ABC-type transport system permease subunit|uniref:Sugar ABC transporter permease YjfF n=1 Tax=Arthrobacter cheniae TaxID=1258888 RepID=A0A3A5MAL4_9MICC|nr:MULTISPECIES: galactofuranose ABC transporter, permease protein YjfF [Arthrobacter]MCU1632918.1 sugar transporter permease YjfF [Micrococcaceae bacterium]MEC5198768.1 ribose/xylose/arabinose/galactoside ABC-type transport system permease subunit [Arthrobacter sp. PL16]RJT83291.1 sugar ABC transporter permease YjfF [Arthrobacter cheniae]
MSVLTRTPAPQGRTRISRLQGKARYAPTLATVGLFLAMFAAGAIMYPGFLSGQVFLNLLIDNTFLIVLAVGMTFVILTGGIDLSVGSVVALSMMIAAALLQAGWNPIAVIALVLLTGATFGLLMGLVIQVFEIQPFIVTLAGLFLARGLCYVISVDSITVTDPFFTAMAQARIPLTGNLFIAPGVVIALVVVAIAFYVLHQTRFGRTVYAIGGGESSALLMGLAVPRTKVLVYGISGLCSAIAGILFSFYSLSGYSLAATGLELDAIAAVVVGGTLLTGGYGYVLGSLAGVLILGIVQTFISYEGTLSSWWTRIVIGALLLAFILLQKLFSRKVKLT